MNLKPSDMRTKVRGNLTVIVWKDKHNVNILANKHSPQLQNNFCDEHGQAEKPAILQDYKRHMRYVDTSDHITNTYSLSRRKNKLFSHLLDLTILISFITHTSFCTKLSHQQFRLTMVRDLTQEAGRVHQPMTTRQERQAPFTRRQKKTWCKTQQTLPMQRKRIHCHVHSTKNKEIRMKFKCRKCHIGLCARHISSCITPNCIFEDQLTLNWKSGAHKHK
jgi:hypothetical protein